MCVWKRESGGRKRLRKWNRMAFESHEITRTYDAFSRSQRLLSVVFGKPSKSGSPQPLKTRIKNNDLIYLFSDNTLKFVYFWDAIGTRKGGSYGSEEYCPLCAALLNPFNFTTPNTTNIFETILIALNLSSGFHISTYSSKMLIQGHVCRSRWTSTQTCAPCDFSVVRLSGCHIVRVSSRR